MSFTGEYRHTIDTKGRLIVPARIRDQLDEDEVVLVVGPDGCIQMWSGERWRGYERSLLEQRRAHADTRSVIRRIAASAHTDRVDRQGRISIPPELRAAGAIERDVVLVGMFDHVEMWSPERYAEDRAKTDGRGMSELYAELNL